MLVTHVKLSFKLLLLSLLTSQQSALQKTKYILVFPAINFYIYCYIPKTHFLLLSMTLVCAIRQNNKMSRVVALYNLDQNETKTQNRHSSGFEQNDDLSPQRWRQRERNFANGKKNEEWCYLWKL